MAASSSVSHPSSSGTPAPSPPTDSSSLDPSLKPPDALPPTSALSSLCCASSPASEQRSLLHQGIIFSVAFGVLEGCIAATLNISHAVVHAEFASYSSATLYCAFGLTATLAPAVVGRLGAKRSMVLCMGVYTLYVASYIVPTLPVLLASGLLGGVAGGILWTAQGVHLTTLAIAFASAAPNARPGQVAGDGTVGGRTTLAEARAINLFSGLFAFCFQLFLALAKQFAAAALGFWHRTPGYLFLSYAAVALLATLSMAQVRSLPTAAVETDPLQLLCGRGSLPAMLIDRRAVLLTPTNAAFGFMTALFPAKVTVAVDKSLGATRVGWLYAISGITAATVTLVLMTLTQRLEAGRSIAIFIGAFAFGSAALFLSLCDSRCADGVTFMEWAVLFVAYGIGIAVWQSCIMALVGDTFKALPTATTQPLKRCAHPTAAAGAAAAAVTANADE